MTDADIRSILEGLERLSDMFVGDLSGDNSKWFLSAKF